MALESGKPDPVPKPGRPLSSALLLGGATLLLLAGAIHLTQYAAATLVLRNSVLTPWFQQSFRAPWLGHSLQYAVIALILAVAALRPGSVSNPVTVLCGLLPLVSGLLLSAFNGSLFGTAILLAAAILIISGALLSPGPSPRPGAAGGGRVGAGHP